MGFGIRIPSLGIDTKEGQYLGASGGPKVWAGGDIGGGLTKFTNSKEGKFLTRMYTGNAIGGTGGSVDWGQTHAILGDKHDRAEADYDAENARIKAEMAAGGGMSSALGADNPYEKLALDLTTKQKTADAMELQKMTGSNLATQRSNLAMRGGLSAGSNERLAADSNAAFAGGYADLATKYGIGGAEIRKNALDKQQDIELQRQIGMDRQRAQNEANSGGLLGGKIIKGWL